MRGTECSIRHRLAGGDVPGGGPGLTLLCEDVAQHHHDIRLEDTPGGGLAMQIAFPAAPPSP